MYLLSFSGDPSSVASRARNRIPPVPPRRMQRSSSKLGQFCHSAPSFRSLQHRTVTSQSSRSPRGHGTCPNRRDEFVGTLREVLEEVSQARAKDDWSAMRKGGMGVIDRAAKWAHVKPMRKRRVPPQGIPQASIEMILRAPQDIAFGDDVFDVEIGDQMLPKGSFLEVRRSVHVKSILLVCS